MPAQPDSFASEKKQDLPALVKPTLGMKIALSLWMAAVFMFYVFMYTPNFIWSAAEVIGMRKSLSDLQDEIKPFFQTEDFSIYIKSLF